MQVHFQQQPEHHQGGHIEDLDKRSDNLFAREVESAKSSYSVDSGQSANSRGSESLEFGFIPLSLLPSLQDEDWGKRVQAVDDLRTIVYRLERTATILPHLSNLIAFLTGFLDDSNLKITLSILEIIGQLVFKVGWPIRPYLEQLLKYHVNMLGDSKVVLRQANVKLINKLMQTLTPGPVVEILMKSLDHSNWRVREEVVNVLILSLSTFPRHQFDFKQLVQELLPALDDGRKRVKYVVVEALAVIYNLIGEEGFFSYLDSSHVDVSTLKLLHDRFSVQGTVASQRQEGSLGAFSHSNALPKSPQASEPRTPTRAVGLGDSAKLPWNGKDSIRCQTPQRITSDSHDSNSAGRTTQLSKTEQTGSYVDMYKLRMVGKQEASPKPGDGQYVPSSGLPSREGDRAASDILTPRRKSSARDQDSPFPLTAKIARPSSLRKRHDSSDDIGDNDVFSSPDPTDDGSGSVGDIVLESRTAIPKPSSVSGDKVHSGGIRGQISSSSTQNNLQSPITKRAMTPTMRDYQGSPFTKRAVTPTRVSKSRGLQSTAASSTSTKVSTKSSEKNNSVVPDSSVPKGSIPSPKPVRSRPPVGPKTGFDAVDSSKNHLLEAKIKQKDGTPKKRELQVKRTVKSEDGGLVSPQRPSPRPTETVNEFEAELIAKAKAGTSSNFSRARSPGEGTQVRVGKSPMPLGLLEKTRQGLSPGLKKAGYHSKTKRAEMQRRPDAAEHTDIVGSPVSEAVPDPSTDASRTNTDISVKTAPSTATRPPRNPKAQGGSEKSSSVERRDSLRSLTVSGNQPGELYLVPLDDLVPYKSVTTAIKDAFLALKRGVDQETWMEACEGLSIIRRLLQHSPEPVLSNLHTVVEAVAGEVQNLRSTVARVAILLVADLHEAFPKPMEKELDVTIAAMMKKVAAESGNSFMREDIDAALKRIFSSIVPSKCIAPLMTSATHRSPFVRKVAVHFICETVQLMGPKAIAVKETERLIVGLTTLAADSDVAIRYTARKCFYTMLQYEGLDKALKRCVPESTLGKVEEILGKLRRNGLGDAPADAKARLTSSADSKARHVALNRSPSGRGAAKSADSARQSGRARLRTEGHSRLAANLGLSQDKMDALDHALKQLQDTDWKTREDAVKFIETFVLKEAERMNPHLNKLFDAYAGRLSDANAKVNRVAIESFRRFAPKLAFSGNTPVVVLLVGKLAGNLASKNSTIRDTSMEALRDLLNMTDPGTLIQPYALAAASTNTAVREAMVELVCSLVAPLSDTNQKLLQKHVVSLLSQMLGEKKCKVECGALCNALVAHLGKSGTAQLAAALPPEKKRALETLLAV